MALARMNTVPEEVRAFAALAESYVAWCETPHRGAPPERFQLEVLRRLSTLYSAGLLLPDVEPPEMPDIPDPSVDERKRVVDNLSALPFQYYREVFNPTAAAREDDPVCGDLLDDLGDIYVDLARGLRLFRSGQVEAAAFSWRFAFGIHWGRHLVSALRALHSWRPETSRAS
jgi:Domain of unknown function (DUF5063)